jgi:Flp pilus assembly protein TadD
MGALSAVLERIHTGAQGAPFHLNIAQRFLIMGRASWFYLGKLVFPVDLSFIYPRWTVDPLQAWQWLFLLGAGFALGLAWYRRGRWGRGPLAALLFFGGVLFPALGFFNVYPFLFSFVADHFQYLACAGPLAALAYAATAATRRLPRAASVAAAVCLVAVLGSLTLRRAALFTDSVVLWRATLEQNPTCAMCQSNLGKDLADRERPGEALIAYRAALANGAPRPENLENDIGVALLKLHRPREAELSLRAAIRLLPNHVTAWINLGDALAAQGRQPEARSTYAYALRLKPTSVRGNTRMGVWLLSQGRPQDAADYFQRALLQDPDSPEARDGLSRAEGAVPP